MVSQNGIGRFNFASFWLVVRCIFVDLRNVKWTGEHGALRAGEVSEIHGGLS